MTPSDFSSSTLAERLTPRFAAILEERKAAILAVATWPQRLAVKLVWPLLQREETVILQAVIDELRRLLAD